MVNPGPNSNTTYQHVGLTELCLVIYGSRRLDTAVRAYMLFHLSKCSIPLQFNTATVMPLKQPS